VPKSSDRIGRTDDTEGNHEHGTDDRCGRTVDLQPREFAEREDEVAAAENQVGGNDARIGKRDRVVGVHGWEQSIHSTARPCS
jgi:hypothetical protein